MDTKQATLEINEILRKLEESSGSIIESIQLSRIEITCCEDDRAQHACTVEIDLVRLPGHSWSLK